MEYTLSWTFSNSFVFSFFNSSVYLSVSVSLFLCLSVCLSLDGIMGCFIRKYIIPWKTFFEGFGFLMFFSLFYIDRFDHFVGDHFVKKARTYQTIIMFYLLLCPNVETYSVSMVYVILKVLQIFDLLLILNLCSWYNKNCLKSQYFQKKGVNFSGKWACTTWNPLPQFSVIVIMYEPWLWNVSWCLLSKFRAYKVTCIFEVAICGGYLLNVVK